MSVDLVRLTAALAALRPGSQWSLLPPGGDLVDLQWLENEFGQTRPTDEEILAAMEPAEAPAAVVLTAAQARRGLRELGRRDSFIAWINAGGLSRQEDWDYETEHAREGSLLTAGLAAPPISMSASDIDLFFQQFGA